MKKATLFLLPFVISPLLVRSQEPFWQPSSGPYGGTVHSIAQDKDGRLYAGTLSIFRSDDHGETWKKLPFYHYADPVRALVVDDSNYIYANYGGSVARSTDHGETWDYPFSPDNGPGPNDLYAIAFNTRGELFVGNRGDPPSQRAAMYRFIDDPFWGKYWAALFNIENGNTITHILVKATGEMFATGGPALCRSLDNGDSWELVGGDIPRFGTASIAATQSGTIFVGALGTLFRSIDDGTDWSVLPIDPIQRSTVTSIVPKSESELFIGTYKEGIYYSADTGKTWEARNAGLEDLQVTVLHIDKATGHLYAGTRINGIFRSTDSGNSWHVANKGMQIIGEQFISLTTKAYIFVGTHGHGLFRSSDSGKTWKSVVRGLPILERLSDSWFFYVAYSPNGNLFLRSQFYEPDSFGSSNNDLFRSTDNGESWQRIYLPHSDWFPSELTVTPSGRILLGTYYDGIFASEDEGQTWDLLGLKNQYVTSLLVLPSGTYLAGSYDGENGANGGVFRSLDSGHTWEASGGWHYWGNELIRDTHGNLFSANSWYGIMKSTNNGSTWDTVNTGLMGHTQIYAFASTMDGALFVSNGHGVFQSTNSGESWEEANGGLPQGEIPGLATDSIGYVYAVSRSQGLYRTTQPAVLGVTQDQRDNLPTEYALAQNYPNPFNPTTKFEVRIAKYEFVSLKVYNLLGEEVATLFNEEKPPGTYTIEWDAIGLPSGVYFYTMTAGNFRETKKLLLVR